MARKTLEQITLDNRWDSTSFELTADMNNLFLSGMLTRAGIDATAALNAIDYNNVQSIITLGLAGSDWKEQNIGDTSNTEPVSIVPYFNEYRIKLIYANQWWELRTIQQDLLNTTKPYLLIANKIGNYWATQINKIIGATLSGMTDIAEITVGADDENFSSKAVLESREKRKEHGIKKLASMYMNSTTFYDVLKKQQANTITEKLFTQVYGLTTLTVGGVQTQVSTNDPKWVYGGVTPIVVDENIKNGVIITVEDGAFIFAQKNFTSPLMYHKTSKSGNGSGKEEFGTKALYFVHPVGFDFSGQHPADYAKKGGLTQAELLTGLYKLVYDARLSKIGIIKVKIG